MKHREENGRVEEMRRGNKESVGEGRKQVD